MTTEVGSRDGRMQAVLLKLHSGWKKDRSREQRDGRMQAVQLKFHSGKGNDRGRQQRRKSTSCTAVVPFWNGK
jgi:hypothetical protein